MTGPQHTRATLALAAVAAPVALVATRNVTNSAALVAGILATILVSPDLDVDGGYIGLAYLRRVSPILSAAWRLLWWPYAKVMPHRGWSHIPIVGTASRVIYLALIVLAAQAALYAAGVGVTPCLMAGAAWWAVVGLCVGDLWHIVCDVVGTAAKRR
jgi:uncharacterized metal-binding protein